MAIRQAAFVTGVLTLALAGAALAAPPPPANMPLISAGELSPEQSLKLSLELAATLEKMQQYPDAIAQYERVLTLSANNVHAMHRLAILYARVGEFDRADQNFQKLVKAQPHDASVLNDWGRSYYLRNNWAESEKLYRRALQIDPKHKLAVSNLALALGQEKRYSEAFQIFRNSGLSEAQAHCNIAFILWSQGRNDEARKACQLAKQLDPTCRKAQDLLAQLDPTQRPVVQRAAYQPPAMALPQQYAGAPQGRPLPSSQYTRYADSSTDFAPPPVTNPAPATAPTATPTHDSALPQANPTGPVANSPPIYQSPSGTKWFAK
jgi:tetratricopeptide (TPR) repeat protein